MTPSTTNTAAPWVCIGCGKEAVGKVKTCDCPSGLIYQRGDLKSAELALTQQQGGEQEAGDGERIYCEARECENCGHAGINDSHTVNAACLECDWSGPSPQEDKCPACQQTGVMTAACSRCDGRYRLVAEAEIPALRTKQPAASEGDERREYDAFAGAINVLLSHGIATSKAVEIARDLSDNTSKQAAGEAVGQVECGFVVLAKTDSGKPFRVQGYIGDTVESVEQQVLGKARREGFKGTAKERMTELGWSIEPAVVELRD